MRVPTVETRRRPPNRRLWLAGLAAVAVVLLVSLRGIAGFYTDYLWFKEVGYTEVWRGVVFSQGGAAGGVSPPPLPLVLGGPVYSPPAPPPLPPPPGRGVGGE